MWCLEPAWPPRAPKSMSPGKVFFRITAEDILVQGGRPGCTGGRTVQKIRKRLPDRPPSGCGRVCPATSTINHNFESIDPQPSLAAVGSRTTPHGCKYQCRPCGRERKKQRLNKRPGHAVTGIRFPTARARGEESQREPTVRRYGQCQEALQRAALFRVTISGTAGRPPASFGPPRFFFAECSKTCPEVDPRGGPNRPPEDDRQSEEDAN